MPLIRRRRKPLALEHMPQVAPALGADDLRARHAPGFVLDALDGAGHGVEEGRPAAAGLEFGVGGVEGRVAGGAGVGAGGGVVLVVGSGGGWFGRFLADYSELFRREDGAPLVVGFLDGVRFAHGAVILCAGER